MNIIKAQIVRDGGPDNVSLTTDLPEATWPFEDKLCLNFVVRAGDAEKYLGEHFPDVPIEVIDVRKGRRGYGREA